MTIFVDSVFIPASVGRHRSAKWCHLVTDRYDPAELHEFAAKIGLKREWFQYKLGATGRTGGPWTWHYDVTEAKRSAALEAGARQLEGWSLGEIISAKHANFNALSLEDQKAEMARWEAVALGHDSFTQQGLF